MHDEFFFLLPVFSLDQINQLPNSRLASVFSFYIVLWHLPLMLLLAQNPTPFVARKRLLQALPWRHGKAWPPNYTARGREQEDQGARGTEEVQEERVATDAGNKRESELQIERDNGESGNEPTPDPARPARPSRPLAP